CLWNSRPEQWGCECGGEWSVDGRGNQRRSDGGWSDVSELECGMEWSGGAGELFRKEPDGAAGARNIQRFGHVDGAFEWRVREPGWVGGSDGECGQRGGDNACGSGEPGRGCFLSGECGAGAGMHVPRLCGAGECERDAWIRIAVVPRLADRQRDGKRHDGGRNCTGRGIGDEWTPIEFPDAKRDDQL